MASPIQPGPNHLLATVPRRERAPTKSVRALAEASVVRSEKSEETLGDDFMAQHGYTVIRFSQPRETMQTAGIPDRRYYHTGWQHTLWWEAKRAGKRQRTAQRDFEALVTACGEEYVWGTADVLIAYLRDRLPALRARASAA